jgi:hypothetical protein
MSEFETVQETGQETVQGTVQMKRKKQRADWKKMHINVAQCAIVVLRDDGPIDIVKQMCQEQKVRWVEDTSIINEVQARETSHRCTPSV